MKEIHISDARQFLSCRRAWDFSSPLRMGYEPDPTPIHYLVGRLVHFGMYAMYEEGVHPVYAYQQMLDHHIAKKEPTLAIPDEKSVRWTQVNMGREVVNNYWKWVSGNDAPDEGWETISNETTFHLPMYNDEGRISNKIGYGGRYDRLARWAGDPKVRKPGIWLWEFKTTAREPTQEWLLLDNQVTSYLYAAQQVIGEPIEGIHFRFLKKKFPDKPRRIRGGVELSRAINSGSQGVQSTYDLYVEAIEELADDLLKLAYNDEPVPEIMRERKIHKLKQEYGDVLDTLAGRGWEEYFLTFDIGKTQTEIRNATRDLWQLGLEMTRDSVKIYPAPEWQKCRFCSFREPCIMLNRGEDPTKLLKYTYVKRDPNEPDLDILLGGEE